MSEETRKNILIITLSNIGDVVLTTPVIVSLRAAFPRARFTVVVGPKAAGLLQGSRMIDRLLVYDKSAGLSHKLKLVRELREEFYDWVVDLRNSAIPYLVRADRRSPVFRRQREKSARRRHLEVLEMMRLPIHENGTFDFFSKKEEASLQEKLLQKGAAASALEGIVLAPGAGSEAKQWRIEGFCEVASRLLSAYPFPLFAVGDQLELPLGEKLSQLDPGRVINLCGELTLRELAALLSRARLLVTNDSASMHLGYELSRPVAALFGPTDPERYGRESEIWRLLIEPNFESLSAEKVFEACQSLLKWVKWEMEEMGTVPKKGTEVEAPLEP